MPTVVFSNHDQLRSIKRIGNKLEKAKLLALLQFTMRAVPTVYNGEEIGMMDGNIAIKDGKDPVAKVYSWVPQFIADRLPVGINRDNCRTPMQWNNTEKNAGFSTADTTWLPVNTTTENRNVAQQQADKNSLLYTFKKLIFLRKKWRALHRGDIEIIYTGNKNILAYTRTVEEEKLLVMMNFSNSKISNKINQPIKEIVFSINNISTFDGVLLPYDGVILKI